jgi:hypothetical protein
MNTESRNYITDYYSAFKSSATLFYVRRSINCEQRKAYLINAKSTECIPLNVEEHLINGFYTEIQDRKIKNNVDLSRPYWDNHLRYVPIEIFSTSVQFTDDHNETLPRTTLPPYHDVNTYIEKIKELNKKVNVVDQFKLLLDITNNNIVGAANLGMMASRIYARGGDHRAYPEIDINHNDIIDWNQRVQQFETYNNKATSDGPGDNYYFWTHYFAVTAYSVLNNIESKILNESFAKGTPLMVAVRKFLVGQSTMTTHSEASMLGRDLGTASLEWIKQQ